MFENFRKTLKTKKNGESRFKLKTVTAYVIFGAIILVFALFGITPERMGADLGGNAAVVNGQAISVASFRRRFEMVQSNSGLNMDQFPAAQRELFARELRRRTLEEMILSENLYQGAQDLGFRISDEEVRKAITSIPVFREKDRFQRTRYDAYLQGTNQSSGDFEREIRKELMVQKLQGLFVNSQRLPVEINDGLKSLDQVALSFRFASLSPQKLSESASVSEAQVNEALANNEAELKAEFEKRKIDYFSPESIKARHILVQINEQQPADKADQKLKELQAELKLENFSEMAKKYSDDPGSKEKGGELGVFEKGRMVPEFEQAAFKLPVGVISEPVKTDFGYHLIVVDEKIRGGQKSFDEVKRDVAQKYLRTKIVNEKLEALKASIKAGDKQAANSQLAGLGVKWEKAENISLAADQVSGLPETEEALRMLASRRGELGLVPEIKSWQGQNFVFELTDWKSKTPVKDQPAQAAYSERIAGETFQKWLMSLNETADIERNDRLLQ